MKELLVVALGGAVGAVCRYLVHLGLVGRGGALLPLPTLVVNLVGCLLLGALVAWGEQRGTLSPTTRLALATGFLGAFTTFSTYAVEGEGLLARGHAATALVYLAGSVVGGVGAAWLGRALVLRA